VPYNDPDPTDPNVLVGVMLPADAEATTEMAYVFAEEFARMGHDKQQILALFKNPYYGGAHDAYKALGEAAILDPSASLRTGFGFSIEEGGGEIQNRQSKIQNGGKGR
jgi:hypothetical protein